MKEFKSISEFLGLENESDFPIKIKDKNNNLIYYEDSNREWTKYKYDSNGFEIYYERDNGCWRKKKYDNQGYPIYWENSSGEWFKKEFDDKGNLIYFEDSDGIIKDKRPKQPVELTLYQIAEKLGIEVSQLKIKK